LAKPDHKKGGDPQPRLEPIRKISSGEMQTKRKILYRNNVVTDIIGSLLVTSSYHEHDPPIQIVDE
jgi:hypothetical protein